jgi:hypothetical protein
VIVRKLFSQGWHTVDSIPVAATVIRTNYRLIQNHLIDASMRPDEEIDRSHNHD